MSSADRGTEDMVMRDNDNAAALEEPLLEVLSLDEHPRRHEERVVDGMPFGTSLLIKSLYFLEALGSSSWGRFATIYYNLHGLNSEQIGLIEGLMPAVRTGASPLWGIVADKFQCRKAVYILTKLVGTILLLLLALPYVFSSFHRILAVSLSIMIFSGQQSILDSYTLDLLGDEYKLRYGRYRMWAAVSWGAGSIVMGLITDHYGFGLNFVIYGTLAALSMSLVAWRIPNVIKEEQVGDSGQLMDLVRLLVRPRVLFFIVEVVVIGIGIGTVERLLFLYLVNDLGASTLLCGLTVGVNVLIELPIFWHAERVMATLGHDGMIVASMVCFTVRVFGYTLLTPWSRWFVLPLEAMHGVTFACFKVVATDVAKALIREANGWNTTIPMAVQTLYDAVGLGLGSIGGGWTMYKYGSRFMYRCMAGIMCLLLLIHSGGSILSHAVCQHSLVPNYEPPDSEEVEESDEQCQSHASDDCENEL